MEINLSNATVEIKDALTWGDTQRIQSAMMSGAKMSGKASDAENLNLDFDPEKMLEARYVTLECAVLKIKEGEQEKPFSREWMNNLSNEDGNKLFDEVDKMSKKNQG